MPEKWYKRGLRYKHDNGKNIKIQVKPHTKQVVYDGQVYESQVELADYLGISPTCLCLWLKNPNCEPYDSDRRKYKKKIHTA